MAVIKTVQTYAAFLYPNSKGSKARINLCCSDGYKLYILFTEDDLPLNSFNATHNIGSAYADLDEYPGYIDLIRNEKPVRVTFRPEDSPPNYVVYVSGEEPGEGEM